MRSCLKEMNERKSEERSSELPHPEQHLDGQLIQPLVGQAARAERHPVEVGGLQLRDLLRAVDTQHRRDAVGREFVAQTVVSAVCGLLNLVDLSTN